MCATRAAVDGGRDYGGDAPDAGRHERAPVAEIAKLGLILAAAESLALPCIFDN